MQSLTVEQGFSFTLQGYDEVVRQCECLAVELLENCRSLGEVQLLLAEKSCAQRFFSQTKFLTYPRMRLAVEHGHKNFAGHIYCQQVVRDKFYGGWWSDMSFVFRDSFKKRVLDCVINNTTLPIWGVNAT